MGASNTPLAPVASNPSSAGIRRLTSCAAVLHLTHDPPGSSHSGTGVPEMATGALSRNQRGKSVTRIRAAHFHLTPDPKGLGR